MFRLFRRKPDIPQPLRINITLPPEAPPPDRLPPPSPKTLAQVTSEGVAGLARFLTEIAKIVSVLSGGMIALVCFVLLLYAIKNNFQFPVPTTGEMINLILIGGVATTIAASIFVLGSFVMSWAGILVVDLACKIAYPDSHFENISKTDRAVVWLIAAFAFLLFGSVVWTLTPVWGCNWPAPVLWALGIGIWSSASIYALISSDFSENKEELADIPEASVRKARTKPVNKQKAAGIVGIGMTIYFISIYLHTYAPNWLDSSSSFLFQRLHFASGDREIVLLNQSILSELDAAGITYDIQDASKKWARIANVKVLWQVPNGAAVVQIQGAQAFTLTVPADQIRRIGAR
ncbi:hypothetical protein RPE78_00145 [Thioclava litoralis]|uniref:Uncharacterized protein n=1 Tax=Thioclava litoralis TaxID=3076557 RepID=A0ABZ1DY75_9RHOB|nr:hypothetical protein RPE78_00145 [Thioclava sp. FTW29]